MCAALRFCRNSSSSSPHLQVTYRAVACTLNGTRSAFTAAMHIALGDACPLDVLRIDSGEDGLGWTLDTAWHCNLASGIRNPA